MKPTPTKTLAVLDALFPDVHVNRQYKDESPFHSDDDITGLKLDLGGHAVRVAFNAGGALCTWRVFPPGGTSIVHETFLALTEMDMLGWLSSFKSDLIDDLYTMAQQWFDPRNLMTGMGTLKNPIRLLKALALCGEHRAVLIDKLATHYGDPMFWVMGKSGCKAVLTVRGSRKGGLLKSLGHLVVRVQDGHYDVGMKVTLTDIFFLGDMKDSKLGIKTPGGSAGWRVARDTVLRMFFVRTLDIIDGHAAGLKGI